MSRRLILVVEDNPITRKMMRLALEAEGHEVAEAGDGARALQLARDRRPDLVVQDYVLPDMDGLTLLGLLRGLSGLAELPALMVTGMVSRIEELRAGSPGPTSVLPKPLEPSRLVEIVRASLASDLPPVRRGKRVLVVDDEPLGRKLATLRLSEAGFDIETAADAEDALLRAAAAPPDAILSDVLMPGTDGFALCRAVRGEPRLAAVPVVLLSSAFVDDADRQLARDVGAHALLLRTPDLRAAAEALATAIEGAHVTPAADPVGLDGLHSERVQAQLEKQVARNEALLRQGAIQAAALSVVRGLAQALSSPRDVPSILGDVLVHCLDAAGLSTGLLYLGTTKGQLRLQAQAGVPAGSREAAAACFGHPEVVQRTLDSGEPHAHRIGAGGAPDLDALATALGRSSVLIVPFLVGDERVGALLLGADSQDLSESAWLGFARTLGAQFGQTIALGRFLARGAASEVRYRTLMEQANDAILLLEMPGGGVVEANRQAEKLLGRSRDHIVGHIWVEFVAPDQRQDVRDQARQFLAAGTTRIDGRRISRPDGSQVYADLSASVASIGEDQVALLILRDVTERRRLEEQVRRAQRMEALGRLASGVAHDFNNLIAVIQCSNELLRKRLEEDHPARARADEIDKAAERASALTRQLLNFGRSTDSAAQALDLNAVIRDLEKMLARLAGEGVQVELTLDGELSRVRAERSQIDQVLLNLVVNARDAMPGGGRILIETRNVEVAGPPAPSHLQPGQYVRLAVEDSGEGMDEATKARIFEAFFTTKPGAKGTGLGLATVAAVVDRAGGSIDVQSAPGAGARFEVLFPTLLSETSLASAPVSPRATAERPTVLLVEDEEALRLLVAEVLQDAGYLVLPAADAPAALAAARAHPGAIALILTDVGLGGETSGPELVRQLREERPVLRVLLMSGAGSGDADARRLAGPMPALQKPFSIPALLDRVQEVLDA
jgi:PAS domain S-box-containing protein